MDSVKGGLQRSVTAGGSGVYEGWLLKQATSISAVLTLNGWRRRWCVLHQDKLEWYYDRNDVEPRGVIAFGPDCHCEHKGLVKNRYYSFCVSAGTSSVHFASETNDLSSRWVEVITAKIRQASLGSRGNKSVHGASSFIIDMEKKPRKSSSNLSKQRSSMRNALSSLVGGAGNAESKADKAGGDSTETDEEEETDDDGEEEDDIGLVSEESFKRRNQSVTFADTKGQGGLTVGAGIAANSDGNSRSNASIPSRTSQFRKSRSLHGDFSLNPLLYSSQDNQEEIEALKECSRRSTHRTLVQNSKEWTIIGQRHGMRIFMQPDPLSRIEAPNTFKIQTTVPVNSDLVFEALMDLSQTRRKWDPTFVEGQIIKEEGTSSIIKWHVDWPNVSSYLPVGASSRSIVVARHWRIDPSSGSFVILYRPIVTKDAAAHHYPDAIQSKVYFGAIYITPDEEAFPPTVDEEDNVTFPYCGNTTITFAMQMDLSGWLGSYSPLSYVSGQAAECVCEILSSVANLENYHNSLNLEERRKIFETSIKRKRDEEERRKLLLAQKQAVKIVEAPAFGPPTPEVDTKSDASTIKEAIVDATTPISASSSTPAPDIPPEPTAEVVLNYEYDIPLDSTTVIPRHLSKDQKSCWWDSGDDTKFYNVRGPNYLVDKVKQNTKISAMEIVAMQVAIRADPILNISAHPDHLIQKQHVGRKDRPFLIVLNFIVPTLGNWTTYFAARRGIEKDPVFERMLRNFMDSDDDYRNHRFKIIPGIVEGPWVVQKGVGNKPAILGTKIKCNYYKGDNCFEIEVDISSSKIAGSCLSLVRAYTQYVTIDLAFLIESQSFNELPERLLGAIRAKSPNLG